MLVQENKEVGATPTSLIKEIFSNYFGEDHVDFSTGSSGGLSEDVLVITVWFPTRNITNSNGAHRTLRDIFIRVIFLPDGKLYNRLKLARTTFDFEEFNSGYIFSHRSSFKCSTPERFLEEASIFKDVCLGEGPLIALQNAMMADFKQENIGQFCAQIDAYTEWESLEGGPYIRLSSITDKAPIFSSSMSESIIGINDLKRIIIKVAPLLEYTYMDDSRSFVRQAKVWVTSSLVKKQKSIEEALKEILPESWIRYMVHYDPATHTYYKVGRVLQQDYETPTKIIFKGRCITGKVSKKIASSGENLRTVPTEKIVNQITNLIEEEMSKYLLS